MNRQKEMKVTEAPDYALRLAADLSKTLKYSDAFNNAASTDDNNYALDIMIGIAKFTTNILEAMHISLNCSQDLYCFYVDEVLPEYQRSIEKIRADTYIAMEEYDKNNAES